MSDKDEGFLLDDTPIDRYSEKSKTKLVVKPKGMVELPDGSGMFIATIGKKK